jgi:DNA-binding LytR/AlgR family response regulator
MNGHVRITTRQALHTISHRATHPARELACFIADADTADRMRLVDLLTRTEGVTVLGHTADGAGLREVLSRATPQVLFVDARLPGAPLHALEERDSTARMVIVVTSAVASDAALAFAEDVTSFLSKPYAGGRVDAVLRRVRSRLDELEILARVRVALHRENAVDAPADAATVAMSSANTASEDAAVGIPVMSGTTFLAPSSIEYVTASGNGSRVHTSNGVLTARLSLAAIEEHLGPARLFRVHRTALINLSAARHLQRTAKGQGYVVLASGCSVAVAKRRFAALRRALPKVPPRLQRGAAAELADSSQQRHG